MMDKTDRIIRAQKPGDLGYFMPPEWHPHAATWLAWPKNRETWGDRLPEVQDIYLTMIAALTTGEEVRLLVDGGDARRQVEEKLSSIPIGPGGVRIFEIPTVDAWIRDYGPNFLVRKPGMPEPLAWNEWGFNAWGNKYQDLKEDAGIPSALRQYLNVSSFQPPMILEGGAIDVNGWGHCLTTKDCVLNPNRNPDLTREQTEVHLQDYLGVETILWLRGGIEGDDTDGHIDNLARFVDPTTIVCSVSGDPNSPLDENLLLLRETAGENHPNFRVIPVRVPDPVESDQGVLPASYMNFYIANRVVLVPTFRQDKDEEILHLLRGLFPNREVLGIYCEPLIHGCGAIHCVTQQQPATG